MKIKTALVSSVFALVAVSATAVSADIGRTVGVTCNGCHGTDGVSTSAAPSLKGRPATYISSSMKDFKSGKRPGSIMPRIAKGYTDSQLDAVGKYFQNLK